MGRAYLLTGLPMAALWLAVIQPAVAAAPVAPTGEPAAAEAAAACPGRDGCAPPAIPEAGLVPEAETWTMMLAGFGLIGLGLRRRARRAA